MQKLKFSKPYFNIAAYKALLDFLFDKCSFNLKYKSFALPMYCFPLVLFIKRYIPPLFNRILGLDNTFSLSCKLFMIKIGVGLFELEGLK